MHFSIRKAKIRATIEAWSKSIPAIRNYTPGHGRSFMGFDDEALFVHAGAVNRRTVPKKPQAPKGVDLMTMFDEGITQIEAWQGDDAGN